MAKKGSKGTRAAHEFEPASLPPPGNDGQAERVRKHPRPSTSPIVHQALRATSELTLRQRRFLKAAYLHVSSFAESAREERWKQAVFEIQDIAEACRFTSGDAADLAAILDRDYGLLQLTTAFSYVSNDGEYRAFVTERGREFARQLIEDERAERKAKYWKYAARIWAVIFTIAVPMSVALLNWKINRLEQHGAQPTSAQPTTKP